MIDDVYWYLYQEKVLQQSLRTDIFDMSADEVKHVIMYFKTSFLQHMHMNITCKGNYILINGLWAFRNIAQVIFFLS